MKNEENKTTFNEKMKNQDKIKNGISQVLGYRSEKGYKMLLYITKALQIIIIK